MRLTVAPSYGRGEEGRLGEAQAEAKHRLLTNMVDICAQIASEQRAEEDQGRLVSDLRGAANGLMTEMRARAEKAERALVQTWKPLDGRRSACQRSFVLAKGAAARCR